MLVSPIKEKNKMLEDGFLTEDRTLPDDDKTSTVIFNSAQICDFAFLHKSVIFHFWNFTIASG